MARNMRCSTTGKDVFFTVQHAEKAIVHHKRHKGVDLRQYRCSECQWWHLTKQGGKVRPSALEQRTRTAPLTCIA